MAALNGTLRDTDSIICSNCGGTGHRRFECTERRNVTASLICRICGGAGHLASDCMHRDNPEMLQMSRARAEQMDSAYQDFLVDIGQKPRQPPSSTTAAVEENPTPWQSQQPWSSSTQPPAPW